MHRDWHNRDWHRENYWPRESLLSLVLISQRVGTIYSVSTVETWPTQLPNAGYCRGQMRDGLHDRFGCSRHPRTSQNPGYRVGTWGDELL